MPQHGVSALPTSLPESFEHVFMILGPKMSRTVSYQYVEPLGRQFESLVQHFGCFISLAKLPESMPPTNDDVW